jgi:hypothetical protein
MPPYVIAGSLKPNALGFGALFIVKFLAAHRRVVLTVSILTFATAAFSQGVNRDWSKFPAVLQRNTPSDVFAVGDVHGDYDRLVELLAVNRLIEPHPLGPEQAKWRGGHSLLVCTGDLIDRWTNGLAVIRFFRSLQVDARKAGGDVVITMGNHEAAFLTGTWEDDRTQDFESELRAVRIDANAVRQGKDPEGLGQFLRNLPIVAVINGWCFVHAGNFHGRTLDEVRSDLQEGIAREGFGAAILSAPDSILEARLRPNPWWESEGTGTGEEHLRAVIAPLGCQHLVTGHQPKGATLSGRLTRAPGELYSAFDGLLFLIDTGMSRGIGLSKGALLWIQTAQNAAVGLSADGKAKELWRGPPPHPTGLPAAAHLQEHRGDPDAAHLAHP